MEPAAAVDAKKFRHFLVQKSVTRTVRLDPFAIEDELGDGALAGVGDDEVCRAWGGLDVDFLERDVVRGEEALGFAAVATPGG